MKVTILGCGPSQGVPRVGPDWGDCDPHEPRNKRRRASILVEHGATSILIDTSPDLHDQLVDARVTRPDAVIWTHEHADHCHGIDDLRPYCFGGGPPFQTYARPRALGELMLRFGFAFDGHQGYPPYMIGNTLPDTLTIGDIAIRVVDLPHGGISSAGLRFDAGGASLAYCTDFHDLPEGAADMVRGVDLWVVDAARHRPHPTHPHLVRTLGWIAEVKPLRAVLTHMDQSMDYRSLVAMLPPGVEPGYDGLTVTL
jgi:phosphoribosyl 1,2-cyclic phosphate phosphodiesterase